jgi:hypothetical protein
MDKWTGLPKDIIIHEIAPLVDNYIRWEMGVSCSKLPRVNLAQERIDALQKTHPFALEKSVSWVDGWNEVLTCEACLGGVKRKDNCGVFFVVAKIWDPYSSPSRNATKFSKYFVQGGRIASTVVHWHK